MCNPFHNDRKFVEDENRNYPQATKANAVSGGTWGTGC